MEVKPQRRDGALMAIEKVSVVIVDRNSKRAKGEVQIESWTQPARTRRALKAWGACWAAAVPAVFIPIAHFILVPGLLLGGIVGGFFLSRQSDVVLGGKGECPSCGKPLTIVRGPNNWPLSDMCSECQSIVSIERSSG
jgi:hypothetical protein